MAVGRDGPGRTGSDTELALETRVVIDGLRFFFNFSSQDDRSEQDEVAESGVDDVAVNTHLAETRRNRDRLMRDGPHLLAPAVGFHRESGGRIQGPHTDTFAGPYNVASNLVRIVRRLVELQVGSGAGGCAYIFPVHANHETEQGLRAG